MVAAVALMSLCIGLASFACGVLPLSFTFSKTHLDRLSALGTGLLLGAALGVIIPEGIEVVARSNPLSLPTSHIALSLLLGFTIMLILEQLILPQSHQTHGVLALHNVKGISDEHYPRSTIEFDADAEMGDLEGDQVPRAGYLQADVPIPNTPHSGGADASAKAAFPLTFGLVIHGIADGLALGVSSLSTTDDTAGSGLSFIVFLALLVHKVPTSFALTTSLLATSLSRTECKKHLAFFSASTPVSAIVSYLVFSFFGSSDGSLTGIALLVSGGTFLYVATVLQPVSHHSEVTATGEMRPVMRVLFILLGMFAPFLMSTLLGHGH